jgi:hypothetical protein
MTKSRARRRGEERGQRRHGANTAARVAATCFALAQRQFSKTNPFPLTATHTHSLSLFTQNVTSRVEPNTFSWTQIISPFYKASDRPSHTLNLTHTQQDRAPHNTSPSCANLKNELSYNPTPSTHTFPYTLWRNAWLSTMNSLSFTPSRMYLNGRAYCHAAKECEKDCTDTQQCHKQ